MNDATALATLLRWANRRHPEHSKDRWCKCDVCVAVRTIIDVGTKRLDGDGLEVQPR